MRRVLFGLLCWVWATGGVAQAQARPGGLALPVVATAGSTVTASWDPNPAGDGTLVYRLYYGLAPATYTFTPVDVAAPATSVHIGGLMPGVRYYFALQARAAVLTSALSAEVAYTVPPLTGCNDGQGVISIGISTWTSPIAIGSQGIVSLSALTGPQAIIDLQVHLTLNGVVTIASDIPDTGGDLRSVRALAISVPVIAGTYNLSVQATDTRGCVFETPLPRALTVQ